MKKVVLIDHAVKNDILTEEQRESLKQMLNDQQLVVISYTLTKIKKLDDLLKNSMIDAIILHPILKRSEDMSWVFNNNPTVKFLFPCLTGVPFTCNSKRLTYIKPKDKPSGTWCGWEIAKKYMYIDIYESELYYVK